MNVNAKTVKRGEIYFYDFGKKEGSIQSGYRPVLVLQATEFNRHATTIIVAAITSVNKKRYLPSHVDLGENFGLTKPSMVLLEQLQSVNKDDLKEYVGMIDDESIWRQINNAVKKAFGFWVYKERTGDIRCLCQKCLSEYFQDSSVIVRRVDPLKREKDHCTKCNGMGYDYVIYDKKKIN